MTIKLTPVSTKNPTNLLRVKLSFMHGDADAYTSDSFDVHLPTVENKNDLIGRILHGISIGLDLMDDDNYPECPFMVAHEDWNTSNMVDGIPLIGTKVQFVYEVKHSDWWTERCIDTGTVVEANEDTVTVEFNDSKYVVPNDEDHIAPENSVAIIVDGNECTFIVDGTQVSFNGQGDCTCDGQRSAQPSFDEVIYFDENGNKFTVSGF